MCLIKEVWKDIPDYLNYQVSNYGRVKSLKCGKEKILKSWYSGKDRNYLNIELNNKPFRVHRLVALAFLENPDNLPQVNHINENPDFNFIAIVNNEIVSSNLEWCNNYYNCHYGTHIYNIKNTITKQKGTKVLQFDLQGNFIAEYPSQREAERLLNYSRDSIGKVCRGKVKTYKGFIWKFAD